jgi:hypothetical protein
MAARGGGRGKTTARGCGGADAPARARKSAGRTSAPPAPIGDVAPAAATSAEEDTEFASLAAANAKVWSHFKNMLDFITSHAAFADIATSPPPSIIEGNASQDPFELEKFTAAMASCGSYKCGQNYFKHALMFTSTPSVPYRQTSISALKSFFYPNNTPGPLCGTLAVAIASGRNPVEHVEEAFAVITVTV